MKETISVLGCGWLGKPLAIELINQDYLVNGSTTSNLKFEEFINNGISPFLINLEDLHPFIVNEFLNTSVIIVAIPSKNIEGFTQLISFIEKSSIKQVIFISSTSVYKLENKIVSENSQLMSSPLVEIEHLFNSNIHFKTTIIRFAGLIGLKRNPGNFFKDGYSIPNPDGFVNMIHLDDCVSIILKIIKNNEFGGIFNACADSHPKRKDYYIKVRDDIGRNRPVFDEEKTSIFKIISNKKLKKVLNYNFKHGNLIDLNYASLDLL